MSKGGGIDTGPARAAFGSALQNANIGSAWGQNLANIGTGMYSKYGEPTLDLLKQMLMGATGQGGQYIDPALNMLMQQPMLAGQQAAGAATRNVQNMGLGPIATQTAKQQIDLQRMAGTQQGALTAVQQAIQQLISGGQLGLSTAQAGVQDILGAGQLDISAGSGFAGLNRLEADAQRSGNLGLFAGLQGIGSIAGLFMGGPLGAGIGGALGGLAGKLGGGGGGGGGYDVGGFGSTTSFGQGIPLPSFNPF